MKRFLLLFASIALVVCMFAGCGKKKTEDDTSSLGSNMSDLASDVESGVSSIGDELMPSSSNPQ